MDGWMDRQGMWWVVLKFLYIPEKSEGVVVFKMGFGREAEV